MFRMLYMWLGNNNVEYHTVYSVLRSCLCMWNRLWTSCQNISMKMRWCIWCIVLFMEKLVLMFGVSFVCLSKIPRAFLYSIVLMRCIVLLLRHLQALAAPTLKHCLHGFCNLVSVWLGYLLAIAVHHVCLSGLLWIGKCGRLTPHLGTLCAKSPLSYSSFGVLILLSYLHECIQPEFPEHGDVTSKPLLY